MVFTSTPSEKTELLEKSAVQGRSLWDDAVARLLRNKAAVASMILLAVLVLLAFLCSRIARAFDRCTDAQGRDMFARTLVGLRMSLLVGVVATAVSLVIGVIWGATAGFLGGRVDQIMMRIVDVLYALPFIFFVIILMVVFGRNIILIFVAIGAVEWLTMARIVRGQTISLRSMEFVEAAQAAGVSQTAIIRRHIVPNVLGPVVVYVTLTIPVVILAESFLSFLGLGVQEPLTSLGNLIANGARDMEIANWTLFFPAATMMLTLFCFNFIGDGLRDAIDPKDR